MNDAPNVSIEERAMAEPLRIHQLTVHDFHAMVDAGILKEDAQVELIDGRIIDKMPLGPEHIRIVNVLTRLCVMKAADVAEVSIQNSVRLGLYDEPEPDVVILRAGRDLTKVPHAEDVLLLIEVADSTVTYDRNVKLPKYAGVGIPEVWIVNIPKGQLECYRNPVHGAYKTARIHSASEKISVQLIPEMGDIDIVTLLGAS